MKKTKINAHQSNSNKTVTPTAPDSTTAAWPNNSNRNDSDDSDDEPPAPLTGRFIKLKSVTAMTSLSGSSVYRLMSTNDFPRQIKLGKTAVWVESEIIAWMQQQMVNRTA